MFSHVQLNNPQAQFQLSNC